MLMFCIQFCTVLQDKRSSSSARCHTLSSVLAPVPTCRTLVWWGHSITVACAFVLTGGCGAMFEVLVEAEEFRGLKTVKQHMLVNQVM